MSPDFQYQINSRGITWDVALLPTSPCLLDVFSISFHKIWIKPFYYLKLFTSAVS